jgi:hypothetical protein
MSLSCRGVGPPAGDEIAALAPNIEVKKNWRGPEFLAESIRRVIAFLDKHTPKA